MRCTSSGSRVTGRIPFTTTGPMLRFGTKWPSITSTWMRSAPAAVTSRTSSPSREKSAESIEGAIMGSSTLQFAGFKSQVVLRRDLAWEPGKAKLSGTWNLKPGTVRMAYKFPIARKLYKFARRARRNWLARHQNPFNFWIHMIGIPLAVAGLPLLFLAPWYYGVGAIAAGYLLQW